MFHGHVNLPTFEMFRRSLYFHHQILGCPSISRRSFPSLPSSFVQSSVSRTVQKFPRYQHTGGFHSDSFDSKMAGNLSGNHLDQSNTQADGKKSQDESWKLRAPYQIQNDETFGPVKWEGACHCGRVQYQIKRDKPLAAKFCHCRACQVIHGPSQKCSCVYIY